MAFPRGKANIDTPVLNAIDLDQVLQMRKQTILRVTQVESIDWMRGPSRNGKGAAIGDGFLVIEQHRGTACPASVRGEPIEINKIDGHLDLIGIGNTVLESSTYER